MGISFLKRKSRERGYIGAPVHDESDHDGKGDAASLASKDANVSRLAILQSATDPSDGGSTVKVTNQPSLITPTKPGRPQSAGDNVSGPSDATPATAVAQTPSPAHFSVDTRLVSPPNTRDDTPLQSNVSETLVKDVAAFDREEKRALPKSELQQQGGPGLHPGKEKSKKGKKKGFSRFLKPPKKDTAPISPERKNDEKRAAPAVPKEESQYQTQTFVLSSAGAEEAFEMGLSLDGAGSKEVGDSVALANSAEGGLERITEEVIVGGTPDGSNAANDSVQPGSTRKNLMGQFNGKDEDGDPNQVSVLEAAPSIITEPPMQSPTGGDAATTKATGAGLVQSDRKFLGRLRPKSPSKKPTASPANGPVKPDGNKGDDASPAEKPTPKTNVPEFITNSDESSMPSMLTEPETIKRNRSNGRSRAGTPSLSSRAATQSPSAAPSQKSEDPKSRGSVNQMPRGTTSPPPLSEAISNMEESKTDASGTYFGATTLGFTATVASTAMMSAATQAGGIEKLLGVFNCGQDTTLGAAVKSVLQCEPLCGADLKQKDAFDLALEEEERATLRFQDEMIKDGVKLIYHESPPRASTNPNWIQSTVKLFLRPGNCHETVLQQPTLAWAVLPVVSRTKATGSFDASEKNLWTTLGLLDVHSILADERGLNGGFFSVTAANGAVYVFEAPSSKERDRVVGGLRGCIARLSYHMVSGNANVIGELYSEDAGVLTGELPSLVSPWKALAKATHDFMDRQ